MSKIGLLIVTTLAVLTNKCRSQQCPCNDALNFVGDNIEEYGIAIGLDRSLTAVSSCFWTNMPASSQEPTGNQPTMISYSISGHNDFRVMVEKGSLRVFRSSTKFTAPVDVTIADGTNHHVCVTWDLSAGKIKIYVDGRKRFEVQEQKYVTGSLPTGGIWIIGQDQDTRGGGFEREHSMKGLLAEVNIWDRILCSYEIAALASSCGPIMKGNVKAHNDFALRGGVESFKPACCLNNC